jgi:RNA polymerase sigma-70 factor (ECF subfamily)
MVEPMVAGGDSWARLLQVAKEGSPEAIGKILDSFRNALEHVIERRLPPALRAKASASDVVQASLLTAHQQFHRFEGQSPAEFVAWLHTILRHHLEHLRRAYGATAKRDVHREVSLQAVNPDGIPLEQVLATSAPSPADTAAAQERQESLRHGYERLPQEYQHILHYHFWEQLSFREIGERLHCSEDAARSKHRRALRLLGKMLPAVAQEIDLGS